MKTISITYCRRFGDFCYHHHALRINLQSTGDDNRIYRNGCNMSLISLSLAIFSLYIRYYLCKVTNYLPAINHTKLNKPKMEDTVVSATLEVFLLEIIWFLFARWLRISDKIMERSPVIPPTSNQIGTSFWAGHLSMFIAPISENSFVNLSLLSLEYTFRWKTFLPH